MTVRSLELEEAILGGLAEGEGLWAICKRLDIPRTNVLRWEEHDAAFAARVRLARRWGHDKWAEEIVSLSDGSANLDMAGVQSRRLMVDARKWILAKLRPELFGDHLQLTGKDGRDLLPQDAQAQIPRLMAILSVLLPGRGNFELHQLATQMARKVNGAAPQLTSESSNGADEEH